MAESERVAPCGCRFTEAKGEHVKHCSAYERAKEELEKLRPLYREAEWAVQRHHNYAWADCFEGAGDDDDPR